MQSDGPSSREKAATLRSQRWGNVVNVLAFKTFAAWGSPGSSDHAYSMSLGSGLAYLS